MAREDVRDASSESLPTTDELVLVACRRSAPQVIVRIPSIHLQPTLLVRHHGSVALAGQPGRWFFRDSGHRTNHSTTAPLLL
jgi:hypothetical protein